MDIPNEWRITPSDEQLRITPTPDLFLWILEHAPDCLSKYAEFAIKDKAKTDGFGKTLVLVQGEYKSQRRESKMFFDRSSAAWFTLHCIARLAQSRSISLLKLNTLAHAVCAFFIYAMWWHKPQDVSEPLILEGKEVKKLITLAMIEQFGGSSVGGLKHLGLKLLVAHWSGKRGNRSHTTKSPASEDPTATGLQTPEREDRSRADGPCQNDRCCCFEAPDFCDVANDSGLIVIPQGTYGYNISHTDWGLPDDTPGLEKVPSPRVLIYKGDLERLRLACEARMTYFPDCAGVDDYGYPYQVLPQEILFQARQKNEIIDPLASFCTSFLADSLPLYIGLIVATGLYGGLHLLAWHGPFPSPTVTILWRLSGVAVAATGFLPFVVWNGFHAHSSWLYADKYPKSRVAKAMWAYWVLFSIGAGALMFILYLLARTFLVVESFIQLAHLPEFKYQEVEWSRYFPHII